MMSDFHNTVIVAKNINELLLQNPDECWNSVMSFFGNNTQNSSV